MLGNIFKNYIYPVAVMSGSIIGVGFLALPYITLQVGIVTMLFYFVILTTLIVYLHVMFAKISLKTPDFKRFPGFVRYYFGAVPEKMTLILTIFGSFGILLVYLLVGGQFLTAIFSPVFGLSESNYIIIFATVLSLVLYFGIRAISQIEFWALLTLSVLFSIIFIKTSGHIQAENLFLFPQPGANLFLPYGAILFALWGTGLIPEIEEMLRPRKKLFKNIIIVATLIPALIYLAFIFLVLGVTGSATSESALAGLKAFFNNGVMTIVLAMGVVAIFMAFVSQGLILKKTLMYDMKINKTLAWLLTCAVPLLLFFLGFNSFIPLISFIGGVFLGINGIFILLMYKKIGGKKIIIYPLSTFFLLGIAYEIFYFL